MTKDEIIAVAREAAAQHGHTLKAKPSLETQEFIVELFNMATAKERDALSAHIHSAIHAVRYHQSDTRLRDFAERSLLDLLDEIGPRSQ